MAYRLLAFWDKDEMEQTLVIATHGINKKTKKTPKKKLIRQKISENNT
ncbi:type II toxin-antitoxin system RelE/ParE family toxin [Arachidicoccus ginsenosidivorans]|nr:type II toxin-antitoxin system RelE/ParE family toxin [Arachidicoccus ginsenosidivorans]